MARVSPLNPRSGSQDKDNPVKNKLWIAIPNKDNVEEWDLKKSIKKRT